MYTAIIIDDEISCVETLQLMLEQQFPQTIEVVATTTSPHTAIGLIASHQPDIVFLDIEMPEMTGIQLLQSLHEIHFHLVFTTAHEHYALQAIKLDALDYLTKPIAAADLSLAVSKAVSRKKQESNKTITKLLEQVKAGQTKKIAIPSGTTVQFIPASEIVRIESQSNYSVVYFTCRPKQTVAKTLKEMEKQLASHNFLRVHHSHLVNLDHVIGYKNEDSGYVIMYGNEIIEISRRKKHEVLQRLNAL